MADPLREKLKALVEEMAASPILALHGYAHAIAALLAESEPNPGKTHYQGDDCPGGHESKCGYCGAKCERCMQPASEPEPCPAWVVNRLNIAVNESCTCGGREPDPGACPACMVWHRMDVRASWADRPKPAVVRIGREDIQRVFGHRCESPSCPACRGAR